MNSKLFTALSSFTVVFALVFTSRSQIDEPILLVGHGVTAPRPLNHPDPEYSESARLAGLQGTCVLALVVNSEGRPENVKVSRGLGMDLDENAIKAVRNWTFEPARKDGNPVAVQISVVVTYRLGKDVHMTPDARKALETASEAGAEMRRNAWKQVYRVEGTTAPSLCRSTHIADGNGLPVSIPGLKDDGQRYRLKSITFIGNNTMANSAALRSLFLIQDGEQFDANKIADGLKMLKKAYGTQGFVSFKSSVDSEVDNPHGTIALQIRCDEGRQFYVDHINIAGLDEDTFEKLRKSTYLKPGDQYNERLAVLWLDKNSRFIATNKSARDRMKLDVKEDAGTLVLTYDFTACAD